MPPSCGIRCNRSAPSFYWQCPSSGPPARIASGVPRAVNLEPMRFDHASAQRRWSLLILPGKIVFPLRLPHRGQHFHGSRSGCNASPIWRLIVFLPYGVLNTLGFRFSQRLREFEHFPVTLLEHMAHQIVLVQALHDEDDAARCACRSNG